MKHLGLIAACSFSFFLGTLVSLRSTHAAQANPPTTNQTPAKYFQITLLKAHPGQDALKMERELWKPLQSQQIKEGKLYSWTVMQPIYAGPHPYNYITVEAAGSLDDFTRADMMKTVKDAWGDKFESNVQRTIDARDSLGVELWEAVESASR